MARSPRPADRNPLRRRLAALRRRLRLVVTTRAAGWLVAILLLTTAGAGFLDWSWRLPALVRAAVLVGALAGAGVVAYATLLRPLLARADDLTLALRIEERYPSLNDALASTVQFLEQAERRERAEEGRPVAVVSPAMRLEAVKRALRKADGCDFNRVVDTRGLRTAGAAGLAACALAVTLVWFFPAMASTALVRLADPFGPHDWPRATQLELDPHKSRIGRNEAFEVAGTVSGVVPDKAHVVYRLDGGSLVEHECRVARDKEGKTGRLATLFRPGHMQRSFSFQVRANDAVSEWHRVEVAPAPTLTALKIDLAFPAYTGQAARSLPENAGTIDAVAGTVATLRASANMPLRSAWVEFLPELPVTGPAALLLPLGGADAAGVMASAAVAHEIVGRHTATRGPDGKSFSVRFQPRVSGMYALHFEDETGLANRRLYELRVRPDRSPEVTLERPSALKERLEVLPAATLPLRAVAEDPDYALRSVWLEYRTRADDPFRRVPLIGPGLAAKDLVAGPLLWPGLHAAAVQLAPKVVLVERPLEVARFQHPDGASLREHDVLTIRVCADDFDTVTPDKQPGRSTEVEIRIVSRASLELALSRDEARVQQDMLELRQMQREGLKRVTDVENRVARTRQLSPDDLAELARAEQLQQQIRERIDAPEQESTTTRVERILETLRQNRVDRSGVQERMEAVREGLDRLSREELRQIEERLATARRQGEVPEEARKGSTERARQAEALTRAGARAEEQAKKLDELGRDAKDAAERERLEEDAKRMRGQAERLREMAKEARTPPKDAQESARQRAELERLAQERERLATEMARRAPRDGSDRDRALQRQARAMEESAKALRQQARDQEEAARSAESNDIKAGLTEARRRQEEVEKTLSELLERLERWSSTREVKGEARAVLEEQRRLHDEVGRMQREPDAVGKRPEELTPEQRARLDNATAAQQRLRERMQQLLQKMDRLAQERLDNDKETAAEMRRARELGGDIPGQMKMAQEQLGQNQLSRAGEEQERATADLEKMVKDLEDRRDAELDRRNKQMRQAQDKLEELADRQEQLKRKARDAEKIQDKDKREEELRRLAREQQKLQAEAEEMAKQLSRMRAERAAESVRQGAKQMEQAARNLERGEPAEEQQGEALDRLDDGLDDLERSREANEDELAREQLARVADTLKRFKERQDNLVKEAERVRKEVLERKGWTRGMLASLGRLAESQHGLGQESRGLAERELASAPVFARLMRRASDAMQAAADAMTEHQQKMKTAREGETSFSDAADREQKTAQRRLQQLLDALKMEPGAAMRPPNANPQRPPEGQGGNGGGGGRQMGDNIPPLAQLKLLRALQAEVNERTVAFAKKHPDEAKLTQEQKKELEAIRREQREVAELVEEYTRQPLPMDGDKE